MNILGDSLIIIVNFIWSSEQTTAWLDHLIGWLLLLSLTMEYPTTVDYANWGKFRVFSNNLLVIVRRSIGCSR